jgi:hypothetical protein
LALCIGRPREDGCNIRSVHPDDQVEGREIGPIELSAFQFRKVDAVFGRNSDGTPVRRIADMPAARACGIDCDRLLETLARHKMAEDPFGQGRPADIAEANKEYGLLKHAILSCDGAIELCQRKDV